MPVQAEIIPYEPGQVMLPRDHIPSRIPFYPLIYSLANTNAMEISLNGDQLQVKDQATLAEVLSDRCFANRNGIAVAVNNTVVPKTQWENTSLTDKDRILVIAATKGG